MAAGPTTSFSKCWRSRSSSFTISTRPATQFIQQIRILSCPGAALHLARRRDIHDHQLYWGSRGRFPDAQPVAFKLMTVLVSAAMTAEGSVQAGWRPHRPRSLPPPIPLRISRSSTPSRFRRRASCPSLQQPLSICFRREQIQPQRGRTVRIGFVHVRVDRSPRTCRACSSVMPPFD